MSLALHQIWFFITTAVLIICSVLILGLRRYLPWFFKYNESFLSLFGVESEHASWVVYIFSWIIGTCMTTVVLTLVVNINEHILLLIGQRGISLDSAIVPLAIAFIIVSIILIAAALVPILIMPFAPPTALLIMLQLHLYAIPIHTFAWGPSLIAAFTYFAAIAIGFVGIFLSLYLIIRTYLAVPLYQRIRKKDTMLRTTENEGLTP
ncbi:MAG: hypothetical protein ACFE9D_01030 [Promethearchaeota archaeon]